MRPGLVRGLMWALLIELIAAMVIYIIVFSTRGPTTVEYVRCPISAGGTVVVPYDGPNTCEKDVPI